MVFCVTSCVASKQEEVDPGYDWPEAEYLEDAETDAETTVSVERPIAPRLTVVGSEVQLEKYVKKLARSTRAPLNQKNVGYYMDVQYATLQQNLSDNDIEISRGDYEILIVLPGNPTFDTGSDKIKQEATSVLKVIGGILTEYDKTLVTVVGHSDASGDDSYNTTLARRRAMAVGQYLKANRVAANRLLIMSYGSKKPIADNETPSGRAKNRRVELVLKPVVVQ